MLQGLLLGVGLSLLMYSVANWVSTRERVFVYYGMTIAFSSAYFFAFHGMGAQHLWGWSNWMTDHAAPLFALLAAGSALLLAERLLDVRGLSPRTADVVQGLAAIAGIVALLLVLRARQLPLRARGGDDAGPHADGGGGARGGAALASGRPGGGLRLRRLGGVRPGRGADGDAAARLGRLQPGHPVFVAGGLAVRGADVAARAGTAQRADALARRAGRA